MSELLNLVGLGTGIVLYAMLLWMVLRSAGAAGGWARPDPLLLATAVLGLVWNLCALPAYELPKIGAAGRLTALTAVGHSALGFLPAVVVHSVLRGDRGIAFGRSQRLVASAAYGVSAAAALLNAWTLAAGGVLPSPIAMRLLTYGFILLVVPLAAVTRGQTGPRRTLWAAALSIFAVSASHLSQLHTGDASWPVELLGHHASLPLAFAILYQDYPFAFADLFLKRALTLVALVAAAMLGVGAVGIIHSPEVPLRDPRDVGVLVTLWVGTALLYPSIRDGIAAFVDRVVLHRPDYAELRVRLGVRAQRHQQVEPLLDDACAQLAPAFSARAVRWRTLEGPDDSRSSPSAEVAASVEIPVTEIPRYAIEITGLVGGRRLLSDDRAALDAVAAMLGRRIDAIRLTRERYERELREQEIAKLASEAELRALRAQINPHFLFNALTTIGYLIQAAPARALETLLRLTSLLRSVLRSDGELTTLGRELELVEAYLDIERARFEDRLRVRVDVPPALRRVAVPTLLLQPVVENAVKHGIAPERSGGEVAIVAVLEGGALAVTVRNTGAVATPREIERGRRTGVGLANIERRLRLQYGDAASLRIRSEPGAGTTVEIRVPADAPAAVASRASA